MQAMIDNDSSKSIKSMAKDMFEFLIRQVVHEDISYFLYKMRKGQFLSRTMRDKRKKPTGKAFEHIQTYSPKLWVFSGEKILSGSDGLNQVPGRESAFLDWGVLLEEPMSVNWALCHTIQAWESSAGCHKISTTISP